MVSSVVKSTKELTEDEIEDYKEAFNNFDSDGNGSIDEGELGVVMRSLDYSPTNQQLKDMMEKVRHDEKVGDLDQKIKLVVNGNLNLLHAYC